MFALQQEAYPRKYHEYKILKFRRQVELDAYVRHPDYTYDEARPGLCFAFHIMKHSDSRYEVSLMFNDQMEADPYGAGIPR